MPANRSRTTRWRECLDQIQERGGPIEIALPRDAAAPTCKDLIWRVRLLAVGPAEMVVEQPTTLRAPISLPEGTDLIGAMSIGQNRWMFHTRVLGHTGVALRPGRSVPAMRLALPERVERCQRRNHFRISTAELDLPSVEVWPVLDPATILAAEVANRAEIVDALRNGSGSATAGRLRPTVLPDVGPGFKACLVNLGGGGVGLCAPRDESVSIDRARLFWLAIHLAPTVPVPLGVAARLAHSHLDSAQNRYLGMAFDFTLNPAHEEFVVDQITACVVALRNAAARPTGLRQAG